MTREEAMGIIYLDLMCAAGQLATLTDDDFEEAIFLKRKIEALDMAHNALKKALQERPKGRWKLIQEDWNTYECTECKEWWTLESGTPLDNNMAYCPFCGAFLDEYAEMRESE